MPQHPALAYLKNAEKGKVVTAAEAVRLIYQALTGLQHIHEQGMVHRDMKPSNLMLVPAHPPGQADTTLQATIKVLDIGLGKPLFEDALANFTRTSPEVIQLCQVSNPAARSSSRSLAIAVVARPRVDGASAEASARAI